MVHLIITGHLTPRVGEIFADRSFHDPLWVTILLAGHSGQAVGNMTYLLKDLRAEMSAERAKQSAETTPQV